MNILNILKLLGIVSAMAGGTMLLVARVNPLAIIFLTFAAGVLGLANIIDLVVDHIKKERAEHDAQGMAGASLRDS